MDNSMDLAEDPWLHCGALFDCKRLRRMLHHRDFLTGNQDPPHIHPLLKVIPFLLAQF
jgi:hypothetical protein